LFEQVNQGQILAMLDGELMQAQLATASSAIQRLMAQLVPTQEQLLSDAANEQINWTADKRRFSVDVENARLRILELKTQLQTDRITLEDLAVEVKITQDLLEKHAITPYELQKAQVVYNVLAKKIEENEHLLEEAEQQLKETQQRRNDFALRAPEHPSVDGALESIRKEINVQERRIEELLVECKALVLKSPFDGMVSQIQGRLGEAVLPGEPILTIAQIEPREVVVYASESQLGRVQKGMAVKLMKSGNPPQIAGSQVVALGPVMEMLPEQLWRTPNVPQWGRPILIKIPPAMKLVPGELVAVRGL